MMSRRNFLAGVGVALGVAAVPALALAPAVASAATKDAPWLYTKQDPEKVARRAYETYYDAGCAEATWWPLVEALAADPANTDNASWATLPKNLFTFGGGGVNGWGTLCGTCNGSAAIIKMMKTVDGKAVDASIIDAALEYYAETPLPTNGTDKSFRKADWTPKKRAGEAAPLPLPNVPTSTAHSQLCHASLSQWMVTSGNQDGSPAQKDRCAKACYDMAYRTVTLLNAWVDSPVKPATGWGAATAACSPCHAGTPAKPALAPEKTKMTCGSCHDETPTHASK